MASLNAIVQDYHIAIISPDS